MMKVNDKEIQWLESHFPNLHYEAKAQKIVGELDFCAYYDQVSRNLTIGNGYAVQNTFIQDVFEIEIRLDSIDSNGWPKVYEIGGRYRKIAKKCKVETIDLHMYSDDGACCLGIKPGPERNLKVSNFILNLIIPFFYRLSYTEKFGITAARNDLWGEYSHGEKGLREYEKEIFNIYKLDLGRNDLCPCGSGKKYKKCHLNEAEHMKRHSVAQPLGKPSLTRQFAPNNRLVAFDPSLFFMPGNTP